MSGQLALGPAARTQGAHLAWARSVLTEAGTPSPDLDAIVLLGWLVRQPATSLVAHPEMAMSAEQADTFARWVARRSHGEPVAYIVGRQQFMGLDLLADHRALLVRPLTSLVTDIALALVRVRQAEGLAVADVGTGGGAIAVALAVLEPRIARLYGTDCSADALAVAHANARRYRVDGRIRWLEGDLLDPVPVPVDLVVANLPYVPTSLAAARPRHEPDVAFDGGEDGLVLIRRLLRQLPGRLRAGAAVVLEIGPGQRPVVEAGIRSFLPGASIAPTGRQPWSEHVVIAELDQAPTMPPAHSAVQVDRRFVHVGSE